MNYPVAKVLEVEGSSAVSSVNCGRRMPSFAYSRKRDIYSMTVDKVRIARDRLSSKLQLYGGDEMLG